MTLIRFQGENQNVYYEFDKDSTPLGAGGMGCIYQGYRFDVAYNIQSVVAIKCIRQELNSNPSIIQRAQREASVQIDSQNLIRMYGFFSGVEYNQYSGTYTPSYYIAMERLVGVNLDEVLNKGVFTDKSGIEIPLAQQIYAGYNSDRIQSAIAIMKETAQGISALHKAGYIHRDIDPSNVMLTQDGNFKVIDFGISKVISSGSFGGGLTQAGQFIGKMAYAAPELITGDLKSQGPCTDIYALGIMFYQLLTGYLPVSGDDQEVMRAHLSGDLSYSDIKNSSIRKVVEKATAADISSRYSSVDEFISALDDLLTGKGIKQGEKQRKTKNSEKSAGKINVPNWLFIIIGIVGIGLGYILKYLC